MLTMIAIIELNICINRLTWEMYDLPVRDYVLIEREAIKECRKIIEGNI